MKLLIFCHQNEAYLVSNKIAAIAKKIDKMYSSNELTAQEDREAIEFLETIKSKSKSIEIGHLFTSDLG